MGEKHQRHREAVLPTAQAGHSLNKTPQKHKGRNDWKFPRHSHSDLRTCNSSWFDSLRVLLWSWRIEICEGWKISGSQWESSQKQMNEWMRCCSSSPVTSPPHPSFITSILPSIHHSSVLVPKLGGSDPQTRSAAHALLYSLKDAKKTSSREWFKSTAWLITGACLNVGGDMPSLSRNTTEDSQPKRRIKRQGRLPKIPSTFDFLTVSLVTQPIQLTLVHKDVWLCYVFVYVFVSKNSLCVFMYVCVKSHCAVCNLPRSFGSLTCKCLCMRCLKIHVSLWSHEFISSSIVSTFACCYSNVIARQTLKWIGVTQIAKMVSSCV